MASVERQEIVDRFVEFYRGYYRDAIGELAQNYPTEQRSLYVDWGELFRFDQDLAEDLRAQPDQLRGFAEEALRRYDLPADVSLGQAHVRVAGLPEVTEIRAIRAHHRGRLIAIQGIVRKATDVRPKIEEAAFECQRCGTLTRIPQTRGEFQEPHECQGCERQGPFSINFDQSEFVDAQKLRVQESPEGLRGGETPQSVDVHIEDDATGQVTAGDHVRVTGVVHLDQQGTQQSKSPIFDIHLDGHTIEIEDEQFEEMDITDEDKRKIVELSEEPDIYERMVDSMAPSIYGYEEQKLAIILQLFSGVRKNLPDGSRIRGDLHMLLVGDPGTGKCLRGDAKVTLADGTERAVGDLVEENLIDPKPVDDGVYDEVDFRVPSVADDGTISHHPVTRVWKREAPQQMVRIRTASGRELEVTPSHPLFVQSGPGLKPRRAEELTEDDFVASPRCIDTISDDTLDVEYRRSRSNNAVRLDLPDKWTPWLARLIGYIVAEGHVISRDDWTGDVRVTNQDEEILVDVRAALSRLGLNWTTDSRDGGTQTVRCNSGEFVSFLEHLEPAIIEGSADQRVPEALFRATPQITKSFLKAYVEGEGHISATQREISVASMSRPLLEEVRSLLLSVGISSSIEVRNNDSYRLRISGADFGKYVATIGFVTDRKEFAAHAFDGLEHNTNQDTIPNVGDSLRDVRERLGLSQFDCGIPRSTYQHYERGDRNPSRKNLQSVLDQFDERLAWLRRIKDELPGCSWEKISDIRAELGLSQQALASGMPVSQGMVSYYERTDAVPDGGTRIGARDVLFDRIETALEAERVVVALKKLVTNDVRWERIEDVDWISPDYDWVYDLEVEGTHTYLSNGVVSHNSQLLQYVRNLAPRAVYTSGKGTTTAGLTAAAVRSDFGDGDQWTLEAGALVLADKGIAAVDELDKMSGEDQSALHQALEQQEISISKAGINATLKSRCSLLGAANPTYGRFDHYEPIGEQIELEPALISRFDLIFTVTDQPDPEEDRALADHIIGTNYAGELNAHRQRNTSPDVSEQAVTDATKDVEPAIDPEFLRKYIAYAKRTCYPTMTEAARDSISDFYVELRAQGQGEEAPVPVTARKLEALVRLAEASARIRLSDTVDQEDADRVIDIIRTSLEDVGMDPETGEFDADVIEAGTSKSQRDRIKTVMDLIEELAKEYSDEPGAPVDALVEQAAEKGIEEGQVEHRIEDLKKRGEVYEPRTGYVRST